MDPIKEAFSKAKQDIFNLQSQIEFIKRDLEEIKRTLLQIASSQTDNQTVRQTDRHILSTDQHENPADLPLPAETAAHKQPLEGVKTPFTNVSTGNRGVPADRQTDQQTDQQTHRHMNLQENFSINSLPTSPQTLQIDHLQRVSQVLDSLDSIKKEIRSKFKRLTQQEMAVFSQIYQLEEQGLIVDYSLLSSKLSLTESSIRDYVQKIVKKGIPIQKRKENNKRILLSVIEDFKKIASLDTIKSLREI